MRYKPFVFGVLGLAIIAIYGLAIRDMASPRSNVEFSISPTTAVVKLSTGKQVKNGALYLAPGTYTADITAENFTSDKKTFTIKSTGNIQVISVLNPITDSAKQFMADRKDEQLYRESLSGKLFGDSVNDITATYPIIALLPRSSEGYTIDYGKSQKYPSDPRRQALYITTDNDSYKPRALSWIRYQGYNPDNYEIVYQSNDARD